MPGTSVAFLERVLEKSARIRGDGHGTTVEIRRLLGLALLTLGAGEAREFGAAVPILLETTPYAELVNPRPATVTTARAALRPGEALIAMLAVGAVARR